MSTLTLIYALQAGERCPAGLDRAALPEGTELLLVLPQHADPVGAVPEGAKVLHTSGDLWSAGVRAAGGEYVHLLCAGDTPLPYGHAAALQKALRYEADGLRLALLPLQDADTVADLPGYTLSALEGGELHLPFGLAERSPLLTLAPDLRCWLFRRAWLGELTGDTDTLLWRLLCREGRFLLCRDEAAAIPMPRQEKVSSALAGFARLEADLAGVEPETVQRVLYHVFLPLLRRGLAQDPAAVETFVRAYDGVCRDWLEPLWRTERKELPLPEETAAYPLRRSRCKKPKVSVVVPIYNVEGYLNQALWSLQRQTLKELEVLCVNDGSKDGSMTVLREYAARDERFVILDGPNGGYGRAMNRGMDAATGAYLGILEPDDFVPPRMFAGLYRLAAAHQLDIVKADFYRFTTGPDGRIHTTRANLTRDPSYYGRVICPREEQAAFDFTINTWSGIYRLDWLRRWGIRHNETPGASYQDNGFWFQTFCRAERLWLMKRPYYRYRQDNPDSSITHPGKIYCISEEYAFIRRWLDAQRDCAGVFERVYYRKLFNVFMITYRRIAPECRRDYLDHVREQFGPVMGTPVLDEAVFGPVLWKQLHEIMADPDEWHNRLRISVILPVYNVAGYLEQCLDSLLQRRDLPFELICVDDGSTDGSGEILARYARQDDRVRVITQPNAGAGAARNRGMAEAKGDYLFFPDADDFFDPELLRKVYHKAYIDESDIVVFRSQQYLEAKDRYLPMGYTINAPLLPEQAPFAGTEVPEDVFRLFVGWAWDKLFRRDFIEASGLRFQEQRTSNDLLFTYSAVVLAKRISTMNNVLAFHRKAGGSLSVTREQSWDCCYKALLALRQQLRDWGVYERFERDYINYALHFSLWNLTSLRGSAYHKLYAALTGGWLAELGVLDKPRRYFYRAEQYDTLQQMLSAAPEDFLFDRLDEGTWALEEQRREVRRLLRTQSELEAQLEAERESLRQERQRSAQLRRQLREARAVPPQPKKKPSLLRRVLHWLHRRLGGRGAKG